MDKEEAKEIANQLLTSYDLPRAKSFIGVLHTYGIPIEGQIMTKQAAEGLLKQIKERREATVTIQGNSAKNEEAVFVLKNAWIEEDSETSGRIMAEYTRRED